MNKVPIHCKALDERTQEVHGESRGNKGPGPFIVLSPIGEISATMCRLLKEALERFFGYPVQIVDLIEDIDFAYDEERKQYHSTPILRTLDEKSPEGCIKVIAITVEDLFIPILTHVYGEAQLDGKACIVSTNRLNTDFRSEKHTFIQRIIKEAIHELGHTFNLRHCQDATCIMHYCRSLQDVDAKSEHYCRYCRVFLSDAIKYLASKKN